MPANKHIISSAGVDDQELPISPIRSGENNRAVDRRGDRRAGGRRQRDALVRSRQGRRASRTLFRTAPATGSETRPWRRRRRSRASAAPGRRRAQPAPAPRFPSPLRRRPHARRSPAALRAAISLSSRAIKSLSEVAWSASSAARSRWSRAPPAPRQGLLARVDERGEARLVERQRRRASGELVALARNRGPASWRVRRDRGATASVSLFSSGMTAPKNGRGAHRLGHVVRPDEDRRRRIAAHALQRREHVGDHGAPALERALQSVGLGVEARQSFVGRGDPALGVLHLGRGFDQRGGQARPVGANQLDFGLDRRAAAPPTRAIVSSTPRSSISLSARCSIGRAALGGIGGAEFGRRAAARARNESDEG